MSHTTCDYCGAKFVVTLISPLLDDVTLNARMCIACWKVTDQATDGQIGEPPAFDAN